MTTTFLALTDPAGDDVLVRLDAIVSVFANDEGRSVIVMNVGPPAVVAEMVAEITATVTDLFAEPITTATAREAQP